MAVRTAPLCFVATLFLSFQAAARADATPDERLGNLLVLKAYSSGRFADCDLSKTIDIRALDAKLKERATAVSHEVGLDVSVYINQHADEIVIETLLKKCDWWKSFARTEGLLLAQEAQSTAASSSPPTVPARQEPKHLAASDLAVQTHKWDGKTIQSSGHCFFADVSDYRCAIGVYDRVMVRVDFSFVQPDDMKQWIDDHCDTMEKMFTAACDVQITFVYDGNDLQEQMDGSMLMTISAKDREGTFARTAAATGRTRRR